MPTSHYRVHGLVVSCDAVLPGLRAAAEGEAADVAVRMGALSADVAGRLGGVVGAWGEVERGDEPRITTHDEGRLVRLAWPEGVRFVLTRDGARVWGDAGSGVDPDDLAPYLLGPVLGFVLRLRGCTALHASAVVLEGRAVALAGPSGAGKSTAAAALALAGREVLADDLLALREGRDGTFEALAGPARVLLWPEAVAALEGDPQARPRVSPRWQKRYLDLDARGLSVPPAATPLGRVCLLEASEPGEVALAYHVSGAEAVSRLAANAYGSAWLDPAMRGRDLLFFSRLAERVPVARLRFDPLRMAPDSLVRVLGDLAGPEPDA